MHICEVRDSKRKILGTFKMPDIECCTDMDAAQEVLGLDNKEFYFAVWTGLRFHMNCKIRQEYYSK